MERSLFAVIAGGNEPAPQVHPYAARLGPFAWQMCVYPALRLFAGFQFAAFNHSSIARRLKKVFLTGS